MPPPTTTTTTSERRRDAPPPPRSSRPPRALVEVLAEEHRDAYDNILSRLDGTSRALLAEASPILADAQTARLAPGERAPRVNNERLVDSVSLLELALRRGLCRKSSVPSSTAWTLNGVDCVILAAKAGKLDVLRHLKAMGSPPHEDAAVAAAAAGRVRALEWCVRDNGVRPPPRAWFQAARGGHVHVLTWLHERERERARGDVSSAWLPAPGPPPPPPPGIAALMEGAEGVLLHAPAHPEVALLHAPAHPANATTALAGADVALLHVPVHPANVVAIPPPAPAPAAGIEPPPYYWYGDRLGQLALHAAEGGHPDVLRWVDDIESDRVTKMDVVTAAAKGGDVVTLAWLLRRGSVVDESTCAASAAGGKLEALKFLRVSAECPWNAWTTTRAANAGHLKTLEWARARGCPWDENALLRAMRRGRVDVVEWLLKKRCPRPATRTTVTLYGDRATLRRNVDAMTRLIVEYELDVGLEAAASLDDLEHPLDFLALHGLVDDAETA